jgi:VWFA-related protein
VLRPAAQQSQPPTFRAGTNLVRVDVTVTAHDGSPVTDLASKDFTIAEDGVPQAVEAFRFVAATGQPTDDLSLPIRSPEHARAEAARDDVRVFVIFWDEYHIDRLEGAIRGRAAIQALVRTAFGPTDLVAITDQLTPSDAIRFTRDRAALAEQAARLQGRRGVYVPARSELEEAQLYQYSRIEPLRAEVTATALDAAVEFLGAIKEGRKALLLVSEGLGPMSRSREGTDWLSEFVRRANATNTAVYVLDPRSLGTVDFLLQSVASGTGGAWVRSNQPIRQLRQMVRDASAFYLLGYTSSRSPLDGKFHKISVHVDRPGVDVKARKGYYAPTLADMTRAAAAARAAIVPPEVARAAAALVEEPAEAEAGDLWIGSAPASGGAQLTIAWLRREGTAVASARVRVTGADGRVFFNGPLDGATTFAVAPGRLDVERTLLDSDGASRGTTHVAVAVPDYDSVPLLIPPPAFYRARTGIELRAIRSGTSRPAPYAGHVFSRSDRIIVRFVVAGKLASRASASARLLSARGVPLADLPIERSPEPSAFDLDLAMGALAAGDYLIETSAVSGATRAKALAPIRVR